MGIQAISNPIWVLGIVLTYCFLMVLSPALQNFTLCLLFNQRFKGTHLQIAECSSLFSNICLSSSGAMASLNFDLYPQLCEGLGFLPWTVASNLPPGSKSRKSYFVLFFLKDAIPELLYLKVVISYILFSFLMVYSRGQSSQWLILHGKKWKSSSVFIYNEFLVNSIHYLLFVFKIYSDSLCLLSNCVVNLDLI